MLLSYSVHAQLSKADSLTLYQTISSAQQKYNATIAGNSQVYNGPEYVSPLQDKKIIGDPYYFDYDWQEGSVFYNYQHYENISLRYDLFEDKLLVEYSQGYESIALNTAGIKYFNMNGHTFVWLSSSTVKSGITEGFYDHLYDGKSNVYVKRYKVIKEIMDQNIMKVEYIEKSKLFLHKDGKFITIGAKRDALNAFEAYKSELKKFLSRENIKFKSDPETALVAMATYYDQLKK